MMLSSMPALVRVEAAKWRRSWIRRAATPASFATRRNLFPKSQACGLLKLPWNRGVGLGRKHVFVVAVAWQGPEGGNGHVGQLNSLRFIVFRLPDVRKDSRNRDRCRSIFGSGFLPSAFRWSARAPEKPLRSEEHTSELQSLRHL